MAKGNPNKSAGTSQVQAAKTKIHHQKKSGGAETGHHHHSHADTNEPQIDTASFKTFRTNKIEGAEPAKDTVEVAQHHKTDSITSNATHPEKHGERSGRGGGRFILKNLWEVCCNETESEVKELDTILRKLGLPSVNYSKTKAYDITDYEYAPDIQNCKSKDFLDFYVFPYLLPAIQALIQFARVNRVFQCRFYTFNALDYIVEYLYNNNPRYPERANYPTPIFEIPFAKSWLEKHPRKPPPKWMLMTSEEAAIIIQRVIRGYMVRCRPEVQEMRQFWREYRKDIEDEKTYYQYGKLLPKNFVTTTIFSPYYEEYRGEFEESCESPCIPLQFADGGPPSPSISHHSDHCVYCKAFRKFLETQPDEVLKSYQGQPSADNVSVFGDPATRFSSGGNEEMEGMEGQTTDTGGENEENSLAEDRLSAGHLQNQDNYISTSSSKAKPSKNPIPSNTHAKSVAPTKKGDKKSRKHAND